MGFNIGDKVYFIYDEKVCSGTIEDEGYERNEITGDKDLLPTYYIAVRDKNNDIEIYTDIFCQGAIFNTENDAFRFLQTSKVSKSVRLLHANKVEDAIKILINYLDAETPISDPIDF